MSVPMRTIVVRDAPAAGSTGAGIGAAERPAPQRQVSTDRGTTRPHAAHVQAPGSVGMCGDGARVSAMCQMTLNDGSAQLLSERVEFISTFGREV